MGKCLPGDSHRHSTVSQLNRHVRYTGGQNFRYPDVGGIEL